MEMVNISAVPVRQSSSTSWTRAFKNMEASGQAIKFPTDNPLEAYKKRSAAFVMANRCKVKISTRITKEGNTTCLYVWLKVPKSL